MSRTSPSEGMEIANFLAVLRRRVLVVALAVVVGAAAAYLVSKGQESKYEATAQLLLEGGSQNATPSTDSFASPLPESAPDRESLVLSGLVLDRTEQRLAPRLGEARASEVVSDIEAFSGEDSQVVEITATTSDPKTSALAANTLARENIALRRETAVRKIRRAIREAERQLSRLSSTPENASAASILQQRLSGLRSAATTHEGAATIVKPAAAPSSAASPKPGRNALIGGFAGLLVGLLLALLWEQLDRRVRHTKQLEDAFNLPVLANVPRSRALRAADGQALEQLPGMEAEAFQILRANLHYLNTDKELRSVVVTSAGVGDGKSTVALNLAKADASVGRKVLLIEGDIRRPRLASVLGLRVERGLTTFLADETIPLADVTHSVPVVQRTNGNQSAHTMDVVVAGRVPPNPSELIDSERMRGLIREAERDYDLVVIDTSPASMVADAIPLMSEASAVVIVGRVGKITSGEANDLREQLERIGAPAYGLVANFSGGAGSYGYGYY